MNYTKIQQLSWYMPDDPLYADLLAYDYRANLIPRINEVLKSIQAYSDVGFGWRFAQTMAKHGRPLPTIFDSNDRYISRAYWALRGAKDPTVQAAFQVGLFEEFHQAKLVICSYIVSCNARLSTENWQDMSARVSLPVEVCQAYEKLFFNVSDRLEDEKFIRSVVYPKGRLVETDKSYSVQEASDNLMIRAAYNTGIEHMLQMAGDRDMFQSAQSAQKFAEGMETYLMAQAEYMMKVGFLHGDSSVIHNARQLIAAAKAGGQETDDHNALPGAGLSLLEQMRQASELGGRMQVV
jgi:hypothetical protein